MGAAPTEHKLRSRNGLNRKFNDSSNALAYADPMSRNTDLDGTAEQLIELYGDGAARMAESRAARLSARGLDRAAAIWRAIAAAIYNQHPASRHV